jgi:hypothetical protein
MSNYDDLLSNAPAGNGQNGQQLSKEEYAAMKKEQREDLFTLSDNTALEVAGGGDVFQHYLDIQSQFDRYSAVNALLIMAQNPEATRVADFDTWRAKGGTPRLGQTGIAILEPQEYIKEDGTPGVGYNVKKVFDISQIDTRKMRAGTPPPKYEDRQILKALISKAPMQITGVDTLPDGGGARTDPQTGAIQVLKGMEFADTFRSVAHELCYAEAARAGIAAEPQFTAYCASYMLCNKHGVDTKDYNFGNAAIMFNGMDAKAVKGELSQIRDAAENISGRMAKQLDAVSKPPRDTGAR